MRQNNQKLLKSKITKSTRPKTSTARPSSDLSLTFSAIPITKIVIKKGCTPAKATEPRAKSPGQDSIYSRRKVQFFTDSLHEYPVSPMGNTGKRKKAVPAKTLQNWQYGAPNAYSEARISQSPAIVSARASRNSKNLTPIFTSKIPFLKTIRAGSSHRKQNSERSSLLYDSKTRVKKLSYFL